MKRIFESFALTLALTLMLACSDKQKADVAERATQSAHNPAQCPKPLSGMNGGDQVYFNSTDTTRPFYIGVLNDRSRGVLVLDLNGVEKADVNGQDVAQKNGSRVTAACVNNTIKITGKNPQGKLRDATIALADENTLDKGIRVSQQNVRDIYYQNAGFGKSALDKIMSATTTDTAQQQQLGLPTSEELK